MWEPALLIITSLIFFLNLNSDIIKNIESSFHISHAIYCLNLIPWYWCHTWITKLTVILSKCAQGTATCHSCVLCLDNISVGAIWPVILGYCKLSVLLLLVTEVIKQVHMRLLGPRRAQWDSAYQYLDFIKPHISLKYHNLLCKPCWWSKVPCISGC